MEHCPTEPYDFVASGQQNVAMNYKQRSTYDIAAAVQRQRNFNYQARIIVKVEYNSRSGVLAAFHFAQIPRRGGEAVKMKRLQLNAFLSFSYRQFCALKRAYPNEFLTPCYDMDIVWHTHQVHPSAYAHDTIQMLGRVCWKCVDENFEFLFKRFSNTTIVCPIVMLAQNFFVLRRRQNVSGHITSHTTPIGVAVECTEVIWHQVRK